MSIAVPKTNSQRIPIEDIEALEKRIGNTSLHKIRFPYGNLFTKLEYENCFGSIKDRPALYILRNLIKRGAINKNTIIIESTSGNFGIALAGICRAIGLKFIAVVDVNISVQKEQILRLLAFDVFKVTERDETGGYLLNRIKLVNEFVATHSVAYNPNQYENPDNYLSYYNTLGPEICNSFEKLDFAFVSVSSGGTIIGLSQRLKEKFPGIKIIGVDVEGSMIFNDKAQMRTLSGIGASKRPPLLHNALIDDVVILSEAQIISGCLELTQQHNLLGGVSSGAAYLAAKIYLAKKKQLNINSVFITPDSGIAYLDTVFNKDWVQKNIM